jgi:dihydrolipoamide dehydrogenase
VNLKKEALEAGEIGIKFENPEVDTGKINNWKDGVVKKLTGGLGQLASRRKVNHVRGTAKFLSAKKLEVKKEGKDNNGKEEIEFKKAIIATGSEPMMLPGVEKLENRVIHSGEALNVKDVPDKLLVVGGGYIGLEMGTIYAGLGSRVTVIELTDGLLPGMDRDLVKAFEKSTGGLFKEVLLETGLKEIKEQKNKLLAVVEQKSGKKEIEADKILISVGRKPITKNLGLDKTKIETDDKGFIKVNEKRQTSEPHIYAIGDVAGGMLLAHKASHEGIVAAESIAGSKIVFEPYAVPAVVFTDPEIAWTGMDKNEAKENGIEALETKFQWAASGRAVTINRTDGLTKLVFDKESKRVIGGGIVGKNAGELIGEITHAIEMGASAEDLALTIHPHPTLSETIMEAAEMLEGKAIHIYRPKR